MTDQTTPASAGGGAQPIADANPIDSIIDNAATEATKEAPEAEATETDAPEAKADDAFPKKAVNALSRRDKQIGKLKAQLEQERAVREQLESRYAKQPEKPVNGEPNEMDFKNYAEYMRAVQKYDLQQEIAKLEGKQQNTQRSMHEQAWVTEREQVVATSAQTFIKENPEAQAVIEEFADLADEFSPELQKLFLEADNAPLAFFNLAKEGKLEALMSMSPARAAMEIGRAQTQAVTKPKTKAPAPLPTSRGSVASGKSLDQMSGAELLKWSKSKD